MSAVALASALSGAAHWLNALADDGPDLRVYAHRKAAHEAAELAEAPSPEEWADVAITLVGTALHHGWDTGLLADAVMAKVAINAKRTWGQTPDGSWQHIEDWQATPGDDEPVPYVLGDEQNDGVVEPVLCPECVNGKPVNCVGEALHPDTDELVSCGSVR